MVLVGASESTLDKVIAKAIEEFNQFRVPEAKVELLSISKDSFKLRFSGTFCLTCGFYDYFDDFRFILEDFDIKTKIVDIQELEDGAIVEFKIIKE